MARQHVQDYYNQITSDYKEMKDVLVEMQKCTDENTAKSILNNIENTKKLVAQLEENYNRISYIMFLLNQPNKRKKKSKYIKSEQKRLSNIPNKDRLENIRKENKNIIDTIAIK